MSEMKMRITAIFMILFISVGTVGCSARSHRVEFAPDESEKLVVYTSHKEEVYGPIIAEFEARTGIWVETVADGTAVILNQIRSEGSFCPADIMFGGGVDLLSVYEDCFEPYEVKDSELLSSQFLSADNTWVPFSSLPLVIIYNNKLVYKNSVPKSWSDLLDERWKGKIAFADPGNSGTSYTSLLTMLQVMNGSNAMDVLHRFMDNLDGRILSGSGEVTETVASGTRLVGITLEEAALKIQASGADISIVYPSEGTSAVPDGCAIVKWSQHEENARKFMDFIVSYDVQLMLVELCSRRPVRIGVPIRDSRLVEINEIEYDLERSVSEQNEILQEWISYKEANYEE